MRNGPAAKDCPVSASVASVPPEHAKGAHGNLKEQNRPVGPARGIDTLRREGSAGGGSAVSPSLALRAVQGYGVPRRRQARGVGPGYQEIAAKDKGEAGAESKLAAKVKAGAWALGADSDAAAPGRRMRTPARWFVDRLGRP
ncbi:MAG: hypothetical protein IPL06_17640 [Betaproteobacteria bacterium]|nr:hypothetical protein [Betaproteobacteria bacterium]